jgi:hypothetical protein
MRHPSEVSNGFTLNMTNKVTLPDVDYINELAREKNFSLGTSFIKPPKLLEDLYYLFKKENEDPTAFELKNVLFSTSYLESDVLFRELTEEEKAYYKYTLLFLEKIDFGAVLGVTPLDKALNVMMYLVHLSSKTNPSGNDKGHDSTNDPNPGNIDVPNEQALQEAIKEMAGKGSGGGGVVSPDGGEEELSNDITKCVRDHLYDLTPSIANVYGVKKPSDVPINRRILGDIKIKAYLEDSKGLETNLETKKKRNNDSTEKESLQMENHSQITKVKKSSMMMSSSRKNLQ